MFSGTCSKVSSFSLISISSLFFFTLVSFALTFSPAHVFSSVSSFTISYSSQLELARKTTPSPKLIGQFLAADVTDVYAAPVRSFQYIFQYIMNSSADI